MIDRRTLLAAAAGAAAASQAAAQTAAEAVTPQAGRQVTADIMAEAAKVPGLQLQGQEQIAMLLYPGFTALDFAGPYHFLTMPGATVHLVTNQSDLRPVPSDLGMAIQPTITMKDCPEDLTVLFAPGGTAGTIAAARDPATVAFMRDRASRAKYVTSVCTGSLILGVAGALRGKRATSHWSVVPLLGQFGATPIDERVVRDGNLITGAGVSAGLDFGGALVAELRGKPLAEVAVLMSEYEPDPPIRGGSLKTARAPVVDFLQGRLEGFVAEARKLQPAA